MIHLDIDIYSHDELARKQGGVLSLVYRLLGERIPVAEALEKKVARQLRRRIREEIREQGLDSAVRLRVQIEVPPPPPPEEPLADASEELPPGTVPSKPQAP